MSRIDAATNAENIASTSGSTSTQPPPTLLMICSFAWSTVAFRGRLVEELQRNGYRVVCAIPEGDDSADQALAERGFECVRFPLSRSGVNPLNDIKTILALKKIIKVLRVNVVFPYTIKPVIYGTLAARANGVPAVALISGLGFSFSGISTKARILQIINSCLYRVAITNKQFMIFQNSDDLALFRKKKIAPAVDRCLVVDGSGVDVKDFTPTGKAHDTPTLRFLMVARLIREKGVLEYIEAAKSIKNLNLNAEFILAGGIESTPSAVDIADINSANEQGIIYYAGKLDDVRPELEKADVFVLPTFYREGIPRSILEALASGLAIVTTDTPGCRETVTENENGFLVNPRDSEDLVQKLTYLIENREKVKQMGKTSRVMAETRFNVDIINKQMLSVFNRAVTEGKRDHSA